MGKERTLISSVYYLQNKHYYYYYTTTTTRQKRNKHKQQESFLSFSCDIFIDFHPVSWLFTRIYGILLLSIRVSTHY